MARVGCQPRARWTVFLLLRNLWTIFHSPAPVSLVAVVSCICLMVLAIPVPVWLTIRSTGTLIPVTRSLVKDFVDTRTGRKPPVRRRSTMPPQKPTDPYLFLWMTKLRRADSYSGKQNGRVTRRILSVCLGCSPGISIRMSPTLSSVSSRRLCGIRVSRTHR
jgi:hypothetical protein